MTRSIRNLIPDVILAAFIVAVIVGYSAAGHLLIGLLLGDPGHGCCNTPGGTP